MKDTCAKRNYKCKCGCVMEDYVWASEIRTHKVACFKCGNTLSFDQIKVEKVVSIVSIRTPTKNR